MEREAVGLRQGMARGRVGVGSYLRVAAPRSEMKRARVCAGAGSLAIATLTHGLVQQLDPALLDGHPIIVHVLRMVPAGFNVP